MNPWIDPTEIYGTEEKKTSPLRPYQIIII